MGIVYIKYFLREHYTDEKLAALLAHCQEGRLAFYSCCCFIGIPAADHALLGRTTERQYCATYDDHLALARSLKYAAHAEHAVEILGNSDSERRERLIPLILAEMARREKPPEAHSGETLCEMVERICK